MQTARSVSFFLRAASLLTGGGIEPDILTTMKLNTGIPGVFVLICCLAATSIDAQSGRENPAPGRSKANQRPSSPSPQPTAIPGIDTEMSNDTALDDGEVIRINTQLVSVPVRVMDKKGRFIGGLGQEIFKVFEDGKEQTVALFSNEHQPFTVALVLDMSYSSTFKLAEIQNAAIAFIDQLRPQDKVMVISFDEGVNVHTEATDDRNEIYRAIKGTKIATGTSLYEAMDLVMNNRLRSVEGRKAVILFTDGVDTTSRRSNDYQNLQDAMELDSLIFTIRYDTFADVQRMKNGPMVPGPPPIQSPIPTQSGHPFPFPMPTMGTPSSQGTTAEEYQKAREYLDQLTNRTGGRLYEASSFFNLTEAYKKIASELREFYSIGYYPSDERIPGKQTKVKVKVDRPDVVVRSRENYIRRRESK